MAKSAILSIKILTDARDAQKGLGTAEKGVGKFQKGIQSAALPAAAALAGIGAAAIAMGRAAAEDAQSQALLAKALRNSTGASDKAIAATEEHLAAMSAASGVADDELRPAMGALVRATGDADKAQAGLASALDISAATGKDVGAVSNALAKGYAGNTSALGRLVPGLDKAILATGDMDKIMAELARTTGGASAAAADTAAGRMQRMTVAMDEAKESIGAALLPAMARFATVLSKVAALVQKHSTLFVILAGVIATVAAAILVINAVTTIYTAVTAIAGAVSGAAWLAALWPILLVIAAVLLVVGAIVLLWKKSERFRSIVLAVWAAIKRAAAAVASWLKSAWGAVWAFVADKVRAFQTVFRAVFAVVQVVARVVWAAISAYVRAYLAVFRAVFAVVSTVARVIGNAVRAVWSAVFGALRTAVNYFRAVFRAAMDSINSKVGAIAGAVRRAWESVFGALRRAASGAATFIARPFYVIRDAVDSVIGRIRDLIAWFGRIRIPKISLPSIPGFNSAAALSAAAAPGVAATSGRLAAPRAASSSRSGGVTFVINGAIDPEATARQIRRILSAHDRRVGLGGAGLRAGTV